MTLATGTELGPYEIVAPLGAGGMGEVYRAHDGRLDREVAIKVLPEQLASGPTALARFQREAKAVAALSHPNILAVHDVGTDQGMSFAVTELLEGETLRDGLRQGALSWCKTVEIGAATRTPQDSLSTRSRRSPLRERIVPPEGESTHLKASLSKLAEAPFGPTVCQRRGWVRVGLSSRLLEGSLRAGRG